MIELRCADVVSILPRLKFRCIHPSGAGVCCFLRLRRTTLLVLSGTRAANLPSPYLDAYGEEDRYLKRGKRLLKNSLRWKRFENLWRLAAVEFDTVMMANGRAAGGRAYAGAQLA